MVKKTREEKKERLKVKSKKLKVTSILIIICFFIVPVIYSFWNTRNLVVLISMSVFCFFVTKRVLYIWRR